jgi:hypothetical protein
MLNKSVNTPGNWLVRVPILVSWKCLRIWMSKLTTCSSTPRVKVTTSENCNSMGLSTRDLLGILSFESLDHLWLWLIWAAIFILGHMLSVWVSQLSTASSSPRVKSSFRGESHCVRVSTCDLNDLYALQQLYKSGCGLIWITLDISR